MPSETIYQLVALVLLITAALVFFIIPDYRKKKSLNRELDALKPGDYIYTKNGLRGEVVSVNEKLIIVSCEPNKVELEIARWGVDRTQSKEKG